MSLTVFYAWQSNTSEQTNHDFIRDVLKDVLELLHQTGDVAEPARLDHDTKDVPGTPNIINTILKKIDSAGIFVGDVTFVAKTEAGKLIPNPNVMFEMGYACSRLTDARVITVLNEAHGKKNQIPFDMAGSKRPIAYHLAEGEHMPADKRENLISELAEAIRTILLNEPLTRLNEPLRRRVLSTITDSEHRASHPPRWRAVWLLPSRITLGLFELLQDEDSDSVCKNAEERKVLASVIKEYRIYRDLGDELDNYTISSVIGKNMSLDAHLPYQRVISGYCLQRAACLDHDTALSNARRQGIWDNGRSEEDCRRLYSLAVKDEGFLEVFKRFGEQHRRLMELTLEIQKAFAVNVSGGQQQSE